MPWQGLYDANSDIRTTTVANTVWTGTHAADGSINIVLDDNTRTGLYAKCGAYRVNSTTGTGRTYDPTGAFYVDTLLGTGGVASALLTAGVASTLSNMNDVANPLMLGGIAGTWGSGATLPDLWSVDFSDTTKGINAPVIAYGIEGSLPYTEIRFSGTPTVGAAGRMQIVFQHFVEGAAIARINGVKIKLQAGSLTNCAVNTGINTLDTANSYITTLGFGSRAITATPTTFSFTYTTSALTGFVDALLSVSYTIGLAFDVTIRIYLPQDERGSTLHDLLVSVPTNDGFYSRPLPLTAFGSHSESPSLPGEPFPFTNGPYTVLSRGTSYNPERRWVDLINPSNGVYNWTTVDAWFTKIENAGMIPCIPLFTGDQKPSWVTGTATNPNVTSLQAFITAFLTRYASRIKIVEGINEVDGGVFWTGTKAEAVALQQFIYNTAKGLNSNIIVLGPSTTGAVTGLGYMRDLLALGVDAYYDVANYHSYNQGASYTPELNLAVNMAHLAMYRRFSTNGAKPLWDSEGSFAHPPGISGANKVDFLIKQGIMATAAGTEKSIWYATDNSTYGTLWDITNGYNDTATALKILRAWTVGATPTGPISFAVVGSATQWTMNFTRPGGYTARLVWSTAGGSYTVPAGMTQYRDCNGNRFNTTPGNILTLSDLPFLIESNNTLGTIISGFILSPAQSNKTIWDTARDGALPGGVYTSTPIAV